MSISRLNYANYSFDDLVDQLTDIIKEKETWKDAYASSTGTTLIELFSYIADLLMYYLERRAQENYIGTAQLRSSLVNLTQLVGYKPDRKVSATGTVTFSCTVDHVDISIPDNIEVKTSGGVSFLVRTTVGSGVVLRSTNNSVDAPVVQGTLSTEYFNGLEIPYQACTISRSDPEVIENTNLKVYVQDDGGNWIEWTEVLSFLDSEPDSTHYVTEYIPGGRLVIRFGDNKFGKEPPIGSTNIKIEYIVSNGEDGNIDSAGQLTQIEDILYDANGEIASNVSVTNSAVLRGGSEEESNESIRYNAPRVFRTGQRGVVITDYETLMEQYSGVQQCKCWGENEEDAPDYDMFNRIKLCLVPIGGGFFTNAEKDDLFDYIEDYKSLTTKITFVDPCYVYVWVTSNIYVNTQYQLSTVESDVDTALQTLLALSSRELGDPVRISDVIACVEGVEGVDYSYTSLKCMQQLGTGDGSTTEFCDYTICLYLETITPSTVYIYWDDTLVAWDDGLGNIIMSSGGSSASGESGTGGSGGGTVTIGTINYTTGEICIDFPTAPPSSTVVWVAYDATTSQGDIRVDKDHICTFGRSTLTTTFAEE